MSKTILGAHIFSVGTWNKSTFNETDLDGIVQAFHDVAQAGRVPLKFGHNDEQEVTDGQPALGWVARIWRDGLKLFADFTDVPTVVYNAIQSKLYKFVSIELLPNAERDGKKYPFVLDAVALLGADPPAVTNLAELSSLTMARALNASKAFTAVGAKLAFKREITKPFGGDVPMDEKEVQAIVDKAVGAAVTPLQTQVTQLAKDKSELEKKFSETEAARVKLQTEKDEAAKVERANKIKLARDNATAVLEAAVRSKTMLPAQREAYAKMFKLDQDDAVLALDLSQLEQVIGVKLEDAKKVLEGKQAFSRQPGSKDLGDGSQPNANVTLAQKTHEYHEKHPDKDVFTCMADVVALNPELGSGFVKQNFQPWEASV